MCVFSKKNTCSLRIPWILLICPSRLNRLDHKCFDSLDLSHSESSSQYWMLSFSENSCSLTISWNSILILSPRMFYEYAASIRSDWMILNCLRCNLTLKIDLDLSSSKPYSQVECFEWIDKTCTSMIRMISLFIHSFGMFNGCVGFIWCDLTILSCLKWKFILNRMYSMSETIYSSTISWISFLCFCLDWSMNVSIRAEIIGRL